MWKKFREFLKKFGDFWRNFVNLLFQICFLWPKCFQILPLDGSPQHIFHVILCWYHLWQSFKWFSCWGPPSSGEIWKQSGRRKQIWKSRLTKFLGKSPNFLGNFCNFFHMFLRPQCTFGINSYKSFITGTPSKMVLFQKTWWKRLKEYSFNLFTERAIVEDCVAVILPPQLTL